MEERLVQQIVKGHAASLRKLPLSEAGSIAWALLRSQTVLNNLDVVHILNLIRKIASRDIHQVQGTRRTVGKKDEGEERRKQEQEKPDDDMNNDNVNQLDDSIATTPIWLELYILCGVVTHVLTSPPAGQKVGGDGESLEGIIIDVYLALLANPGGLEAKELSNVREDVKIIIARENNWGLALKILTGCVASVGQKEHHDFSLPEVCKSDNTMNTNTIATISDLKMREMHYVFKSNEAIRLAADLIEVALSTLGSQNTQMDIHNAELETDENESSTIGPLDVIRYAIDVALKETLNQVVLSASLVDCKQNYANDVFLARYLLPACLAAAQVAGKLGEAVSSIWVTCKRLAISENRKDQKASLALMVQFCNALLEHGNVLEDETFWDTLLYFLDSPKGIERKRALYILEVSVKAKSEVCNDVAGKSPPYSHHGSSSIFVSPETWSTFLKLHAAVDDTALHLFKESWPLIDEIHSSEKLNSGGNEVNRLNNAPEMDNCGHNELQQEIIAMPFKWVKFLWKKALAANHMTAQKLSVVSFLSRSWPSKILKQLSPSFCSSLADALSVPGVAKGDMSKEINQMYPLFFRKWATSLDGEDQFELLLSVLELMAVPTKRPDTQTTFAATALTEISFGIGFLEDKAMHVRMLEKARNVCKKYHGYGSNAIALHVYSSITTMMTNTIREPLSAEVLGRIGSMLQPLPLPLIQPGGTISSITCQWMGKFLSPVPEDAGHETKYRKLNPENHSSGKYFKNAQSHDRLVNLLKTLVDSYLRELGTRHKAETNQEHASAPIAYSCDPESLSRVILICANFMTPEDLDTVLDSLVKNVLSESNDNADTARKLEVSLPFFISLFKSLIPLPSRDYQQTKYTGSFEDSIQGILSNQSKGCFALETWIVAHLVGKHHFVESLCQLNRHRTPCLILAANPESLTDLANYCSRQCQVRSISTGEGFNLDSVLPAEFIEKRNFSCNTVDCIAVLAKVVVASNQISNQQIITETLMLFKNIKAYMESAIIAYSSMWESFHMKDIPISPNGDVHGEFLLMSLRARLEVGYSLLRPFVACSEALEMVLFIDSNENLNLAEYCLEVTSICQFLDSACNVLSQQQLRFLNMDSIKIENTASIQSPKKPNNSKKKMKKGRKNPCLTLESWHSLTAWRAIDAIVSMRSAWCNSQNSMHNQEDVQKNSKLILISGPFHCFTVDLPISISAKLFAVATLCIKFSSDSSCTPLISCLRCIRPIISDFLDRNNTLNSQLIDSIISTLRENGFLIESERSKGDALNGVISWLGNILIDTFLEQSRGRTGLGAALLTTIIQPKLFSFNENDDELCSLLHSKTGSIHRAIERLMDAIENHARLMALLSSHFAALLAAFPFISKFYVDLISRVAMFGVDDQSRLSSLSDVTLDVPSARELAAVLPDLNESLSMLHSGTAAAPRIGMVALLHEWVSEHSNSGDKNSSCGNSVVLIGVWHHLLSKALNDPALSSEKYLHFGPTHRKKLRVWQALTMLCPIVPKLEARNTLQKLISILACTNAASVKQYQEIVALQMVMLDPILLYDEVLPRISSYSNQRHEAMPSLIAIGTQSALEIYLSTKSVDESLPNRYRCKILEKSVKQALKEKTTSAEEVVYETVLTVLPWCMSYNHGNRTFSQLLIWRIIELCPFLKQRDRSLKTIAEFFDQNKDLHRLRASFGIDKALDRFNLQYATSPKGILCESIGLLGTANVPPVNTEDNSAQPFEGAPESLMEALNAYLQKQRVALKAHVQNLMTENVQQDEERLLQSATKLRGELDSEISLGDVPKTLKESDSSTDTQAAEKQRSSVRDWQRKYAPTDKEAAIMDPWGAALGLSVLSTSINQSISGLDSKAGHVPIDKYEIENRCSALRDALQAHTEAGGIRQDLIVVASLIDRVPNLAGLARTCEVFRAASLVFSDKSVIKDSEFSHISVSAEHWVPIEEVSRDALGLWLRRKSLEGYTVVGLEQTAGSVRLSEFNFPRKTVLVLGAEKEGIPANLLDLLDVAVEIPQLGVVRSLNVHVSAACAIYEFTRQGLS